MVDLEKFCEGFNNLRGVFLEKNVYGFDKARTEQLNRFTELRHEVIPKDIVVSFSGLRAFSILVSERIYYVPETQLSRLKRFYDLMNNRFSQAVKKVEDSMEEIQDHKNEMWRTRMLRLPDDIIPDLALKFSCYTMIIKPPSVHGEFFYNKLLDLYESFLSDLRLRVMYFFQACESALGLGESKRFTRQTSSRLTKRLVQLFELNPFHFDERFISSFHQVKEYVTSRFDANSPLTILEQYMDYLKKEDVTEENFRKVPQVNVQVRSACQKLITKISQLEAIT